MVKKDKKIFFVRKKSPGLYIKNLNFIYSKKGQGHVEMMISTVFFLGFLVFVFIFMNPFNVIKQGISLDPAKNAILKEIQSDVGILSVIVNTTSDCYNLTEINFLHGNNFTEAVNLGRKYSIYYGNFFDPGVVGYNSCYFPGVQMNYTLGGYIEEKMIVYERIQALKSFYDSNYGGTKDLLGIGDFEFQFKDFNNSEIPELSVRGKIPENVDVFSRENPVRVINKAGDIREYIFKIRVW